jgi:N-acetylmuramoyl-L-alanine amidase
MGRASRYSGEGGRTSGERSRDSREASGQGGCGAGIGDSRPRVGWRLAVLASVFLSAIGAAAAGERAPATAALPVATEARLAGDDTRTRLVIDVSQNIGVTAFTLADPYRVVIDIPQVVFQFPPKTGESGRGLIKAFRYGLVMPGGSRLVIDTKGPVRVDKAFVLDPVDTQPARLVLDLTAVDRATFMRTLAVDNKARRPPEAKKPDRDTSVKPADPRPLVMLDPGHGGIDNGTSAPSGESEKTIVLDFALALRDKLEKSGKYRVAMTRVDDRFVPLGERVRMARAQSAALFISIHADALAKEEGDARGAAVYTLAETASDTEAGRLAEAENRADVIAGVDLSGEPDEVADILIDLAQRETKHFSVHFAKTLLRELKTSARLHKHPIKSAGFRVLKAPDVPSVLIELGYMTSRQDLKLLTSETWRGRAADSIVQAVHAFFSAEVANQSAQSGAN